MAVSGSHKKRQRTESPYLDIFDEGREDTEFYEERVRKALDMLPPVKFAFAYGSGAVPQIGSYKETCMLDLILVLENSFEWHRENMERNPSHYAFLPKALGPKWISWVQTRKLGVPVLYNTLIPFEGGLMKYGCVAFSDLLEDLQTWRYLYLAGRLQKPVRMYVPSKALYCNSKTGEKLDGDLVELNQALLGNLEAALSAAVILLPFEFSEVSLFQKISQLSYYGDIRFAFSAENPRKVSNIVTANLLSFRNLYYEAFNSLLQDRLLRFHFSPSSGHHVYVKSESRAGLLGLLQRIPSHFVKRCYYYSLSNTSGDVFPDKMNVDEARESISRFGMRTCQDILKKNFKNTVRVSSMGQALKGLFSAEMAKSRKEINSAFWNCLGEMNNDRRNLNLTMFRMLRKETSPDWLQVETRLRFVDSRFNASLYVIDLSGDLNNYPYFRLSRASWTKLVQNRINYVAFFYREPPFLLGNSYFERALESLESCPIPGFGIALSTCGCIVPSSILESLKGSFEGLECLALPGFVVDREFVVWFDSDEEELNSRKPSKYCGNPRILNMRLFPAFDNLLREARGDFARLLEQKMSSVTGHL